MQKRFLRILLFAVLSLFILTPTSCSKNEYESSKPDTTNSNISSKLLLTQPDSIIFHNKGKCIQLKQGTEAYNKTVNLTNNLVESISDSYSSAIPKSDLDMMLSEGCILEFAYSSQHVFKYRNTNKSEISVHYKKLYFPLDNTISTKKYTSYMINIIDDGVIDSSKVNPLIKIGSGGPCQITSNSNELINYLINLKI